MRVLSHTAASLVLNAVDKDLLNHNNLQSVANDFATYIIILCIGSRLICPLALLDIHNIHTVHAQMLYNKYRFDYRLSIENAIIVLLFKFGLLYRCHHLHLAVIVLKCGVV